MKNHFFFPYFGNKRNEIELFFDVLDLSGVTTIIEPFCGSCAFSVYMSQKFPKKYKYILIDNNDKLIDLLKLAKNQEKFSKFIENINNKCFVNNKFIDKTEYTKIIKQNDVESFFISSKFYSIRPSLYPYKPMIQCKNYFPINDFLQNENVELLHADSLDFILQNVNNESNLFFLDPPYLNSSNGFYDNPKGNIYEIVCKNIELFLNCKSKLYFCLENNWIITLLFKDFSFYNYNKSYNSSKIKTIHCLIYNR